MINQIHHTHAEREQPLDVRVEGRESSLETASAPETDVRVRDGKSYLLPLEWPDPQSGRARVHSLHFANPKEQPAALTRLFDEVGALARTRVSTVKLEYFRP